MRNKYSAADQSAVVEVCNYHLFRGILVQNVTHTHFSLIG